MIAKKRKVTCENSEDTANSNLKTKNELQNLSITTAPVEMTKNKKSKEDENEKSTHDDADDNNNCDDDDVHKKKSLSITTTIPKTKNDDVDVCDKNVFIAKKETEKEIIPSSVTTTTTTTIIPSLSSTISTTTTTASVVKEENCNYIRIKRNANNFVMEDSKFKRSADGSFHCPQKECGNQCFEFLEQVIVHFHRQHFRKFTNYLIDLFWFISLSLSHCIIILFTTYHFLLILLLYIATAAEYKCIYPNCDQLFYSPFLVNWHFENEHAKTFKCDLCETVDSFTKRGLSIHKNKKHNVIVPFRSIPPFPCNDLYHSFKNSSG
jgi:hypothetical protein